MIETPQSSGEPTIVTGQYDDRYGGPSRLGQVAAWVVIIAGVVFVVGVIFFSGLLLGWSAGSHHGWHRGYYFGRDGTCQMMGPGGMMEPGGMMGPGGMTEPGGMMGPRQTPTTMAPATPRP
jgi:hypothetical protein